MTAVESPLLQEALPVSGGRYIMIARLNAPRALNALNLEMVDALSDCLRRWQDDPAVVAVWLEGEGERSFCAGGDVARIHREVTARPAEGADYAAAFFRREYALDHLIHTYPKPLLCWGQGIVMGGGLGLMVGAGHRIVTESTRIAMPEITIGLYPDVGGSWFLNRLPGHCGLFCALTGASLNAADALFLGLADRYIPAARKPRLLEALASLPWQGQQEADNALLLAELPRWEERAGLPFSPVREHFDHIQALCDRPTLAEVVEAITTGAEGEGWLAEAGRSLRAGSAVSACVIDRLLRETRHASLTEVFALEARLSPAMVAWSEFMEGVRAQLIDKDRQPRWRHASVRDVPASLLDQLFAGVEPAASGWEL